MAGEESYHSDSSVFLPDFLIHINYIWIKIFYEQMFITFVKKTLYVTTGH